VRVGGGAEDGDRREPPTGPAGRRPAFDTSYIRFAQLKAGGDIWPAVMTGGGVFPLRSETDVS
jgi:hypothetical protein